MIEFFTFILFQMHRGMSFQKNTSMLYFQSITAILLFLFKAFTISFAAYDVFISIG